MSGTIMNMSMYDQVMEIQDLNKVEGFDPRKYMRMIQGEGQASRCYLDVAFRKLWFRLKYPEGKIAKKVIKLTEQVAIMEARVYLNRNDPEDSYISNALAQKYFSTEDQFGNKYVELAETAAVGRALADAGFGLQFADQEGEWDQQVTDAPFEAGMLFGKGNLLEDTYPEDGEVIGSLDTGMEADFMEQAGEQVSEDNLPGQHNIEEYIPVPAGNRPQTGQMFGMTPATQQKSTLGQTVPKAGSQITKQQGVQAHVDIQKNMPVEQIYPLLNRERAVAVVISAGCHKGKTLGQLAVEKPQSLEWYVSSYGGPDNLLRAAAKFLMDTALGQAG